MGAKKWASGWRLVAVCWVLVVAGSTAGRAAGIASPAAVVLHFLGGALGGAIIVGLVWLLVWAVRRLMGTEKRDDYMLRP